MFIDFVCLCPIRVVIMLNFNVSKEVCWINFFSWKNRFLCSFLLLYQKFIYLIESTDSTLDKGGLKYTEKNKWHWN